MLHCCFVNVGDVKFAINKPCTIVLRRRRNLRLTGFERWLERLGNVCGCEGLAG